MALALVLFPLMCFAYWKALNMIVPPYVIDYEAEAMKMCRAMARHNSTGLSPVEDPTSTAMMMDMGEL